MNSSFSSSKFCRPSVEAVDERKTWRIDWELHHGIYPARRIYSKRWNVTPTVNHRCMEVRSTTFVPRGFSPRLRLAPSPPPPVNSAPALRERETSGTQGTAFAVRGNIWRIIKTMNYFWLRKYARIFVLGRKLRTQGLFQEIFIANILRNIYFNKITLAKINRFATKSSVLWGVEIQSTRILPTPIFLPIKLP